MFVRFVGVWSVNLLHPRLMLIPLSCQADVILLENQ